MQLDPVQTRQPLTQMSNPCCCNKANPYVKTAELVAVVVIGIIGLNVNSLLFVGALTLGALYQFTLFKMNLSSPENGSSRPGCGQGYGEFFSGVKFWPIEVVVVIAALAWEHLQMDPHFYAPFFGFFIGRRAMHVACPLVFT